MILRFAVLTVAAVLAGWSLAPVLPQLPGLLAQAGGGTLAIMVVAHVVPVALCGLAWGCVLPRAGAGQMMALRWLRDGLNEMLAVVPLAGEAASLRLLGRRGIGVAASTAAMVADLTAEVVAQGAFCLIGVALWAGRGGALPWWGVPSAAAVLAVIGGFVAAQRGGGLRLAERMAARLLPRRGNLAGLHNKLMALYRHPWRPAAALGLHLLAWLAACAEAWVGLRLLGHPVTVADAVMLECAVFALRSVAFMVPGALGVQEGAYALLAPLIGVPPALAVTLSLLKRGRELTLGIPALLLWTRLSK